jgi:hypothetical protein
MIIWLSRFVVKACTLTLPDLSEYHRYSDFGFATAAARFRPPALM